MSHPPEARLPRKKGEYEANLTYGWPRFARSLSSHELLQPPFLNMGEGTGTHIGISEHVIIRHIRNLRVNRTHSHVCDSHIGRESSELFTKYERIMLDNGQKIAGGLLHAIASNPKIRDVKPKIHVIAQIFRLTGT